MKVEIWSDIVCPWCYIGKRRFETALARFAHRDEVEVIWRSFELDPSTPRESSGTLDVMLARKYGMSPERAAAAHDQLTAVAAEEGLDYHFELAKHGNTFDAHRLIHLAAAHNRQAAMKERLLRAYFTEGQAIGDVESLAALAGDVGIDADEARRMLSGEDYADEVRADEKRARDFGISGVPFVAIDERYGVSGAQPPEAFLSALEQAWTAAHPLAMVGMGGGTGTCEGDACVV